MKYTPRKGFYDLSEKPATLSQKEFEKIQSIQTDLMFINEKLEYYEKYEPFQIDKMQEVHANLQIVIMQHWTWEKKKVEPKQLSLDLTL